MSRPRQTKEKLKVAEEQGLRQCPSCMVLLDEKAYPPSAWKKGVGNPCRKCSSIARKSKRKADPERFRAADKKRYRTYKYKSVRAYQYKKEYGLTVPEVDAMFERQLGRCLGCQKDLIKEGPRGTRFCVDHDHITKKVRGLLCNLCNRGLGMLEDNPSTLRRLLSYLQSDRDKKSVYIIGSLRNPIIPEVGNKLREAGFDALDDWHSAGPEADDKWQEYENRRGRSYIDALKGRSAQNVFLFDRSLLDIADYAVLVSPGGRSAFIELGYFTGKGKPGFILNLEEPERFEVMPNFAAKVVSSVEKLIEELKK